MFVLVLQANTNGTCQTQTRFKLESLFPGLSVVHVARNWSNQSQRSKISLDQSASSIQPM